MSERGAPPGGRAPQNCKSSLGCLHDGSFVLQTRGTGIEAHGQLDGRNRGMCALQTLVPAVTARRDLAPLSHSFGGARAAPALPQPWSPQGLVCTPGPHFPGLRLGLSILALHISSYKLQPRKDPMLCPSQPVEGSRSSSPWKRGRNSSSSELAEQSRVSREPSGAQGAGHVPSRLPRSSSRGGRRAGPCLAHGLGLIKLW